MSEPTTPSPVPAPWPPAPPPPERPSASEVPQTLDRALAQAQTGDAAALARYLVLRRTNRT